MAAEKPFILPVVIDETRETTALVPDKFREVQWTRLLDPNDSQALVTQLQRLLPMEPTAATAKPPTSTRIDTPPGQPPANCRPAA